MNNILTQKQEDFTRYIFEGKTQREAWGLAGYSTNYPVVVIDSNACKLYKKNKIQTRLIELRSKVADKSIATVNERKQILTDIARAKAKNAVHAVDIHNKMDNLYSEVSVYNDNRSVNIIVRDKEVKELLEKINERVQ